LLVSVIFVGLESTTRLLEPLRNAVATAATPLVFLAEVPYLLTQEMENVVASQASLVQQNAQLERRVLELSQVSQQFLTMKMENERLRELLGSRARLPAEVLVAELVGVVPAPNTHQVIIDKGRDSRVQVGQAVIDAEGLFGQVVEVDAFTSRVLLITDADHAVPVQVNRNGVRSIAGGTGEMERLQLEKVSVTADIREGDLLETSGLGGRFPRGYPVGYVETVLIEPTSPFAEVTVRPLAALDRSRHVLVVFSRAEDADGGVVIDDEPEQAPDEQANETEASAAADVHSDTGAPAELTEAEQ
jgi:rod shape-determining protein MreC